MKFILTFAMILFYPDVFAHQENNSEEYRVLKKIELEKGRAFVVARMGGHLIGQPYQVELKVQCDKRDKKLDFLKIADSFSVCDLSPDSVTINQTQTAVALKVKMADLKNYHDQIESGSLLPQAKCADPTHIKKFSLKNLCQ